MAEITIHISDKALKIVAIGLATLCLAWIVLRLWSSGFLLPKYRLRMYVPEAADLAVDAPVVLDGIKVGTVDAINLAGTSATSQRRIELILRIEKRYQDKIRTDSTATLLTEGLLGARYVSIQRGLNGSPTPANGEIAAVQVREFSIRDFIDRLAKRIDCSAEEKDGAKDKLQSH